LADVAAMPSDADHLETEASTATHGLQGGFPSGTRSIQQQLGSGLLMQALAIVSLQWQAKVAEAKMPSRLRKSLFK